MGALVIPEGARVYIDANVFIYTVERHPVYYPLLRPLWQASQEGRVQIYSSELLVLEAMVLPLRHANASLVADYQRALTSPDLMLLPVTREILVSAAQMRAAVAGLPTPDAIHAATAMHASCNLFLTNDNALRRVEALHVVLLNEVL